MFLERGADNQEEQAVVWWLVMFVGLFQVLHSITDRATTWLIQFLSALLKCLAAISRSARIQRIYSLFPLPSIASNSTLQTVVAQVISQSTLFVPNVKLYTPLMNLLKGAELLCIHTRLKNVLTVNLVT